MTKVISLSDKAYVRLKTLKEGKDSFSDVVLRITDESMGENTLPNPGGWKDMPEMDAIMEDIMERRHKTGWRAR